ncbi:hemerythrin domain-containing protein [Vampirovibrio sp.]|uniref:hemerythrin domain-containing protein n=1 Tax=Vampirovibrio sp. TaxID=2717857 RepID=UPI0035935F89
MDFFTLLKDEHKEAQGTFRELFQETEIDPQKAEVLCQKLLVHMEMEEKYFYPVMQEHKTTKELSKEATLEHSEAKKLIKAMLEKNLDETEYKVKLEMLQLAIEHHIEEEEKEVLPKAEKWIQQDKVQEITEKMLALKERKKALISG